MKVHLAKTNGFNPPAACESYGAVCNSPTPSQRQASYLDIATAPLSCDGAVRVNLAQRMNHGASESVRTCL